MPIQRRSSIFSQSRGFTLMELMIGLGISGIVFLALMTLITQSAKFSGYFHGTANSIEGVNDAVSQLNAVMSQVVAVTSCGCRGTTNAELSNCLWDSTDSSTAWYDPVIDGGMSNSSNGGLGHLIFSGLYESFFGGENAPLAPRLPGTLQLLTTDILASSFGDSSSPLGPCRPNPSMTDDNQRGCKRKIRLYYRAPEVEVTTPPKVPAKSGSLSILVGGDDVTAVSPTSPGLMRIGMPTREGANGLGLSRLSCGFNKAVGTSNFGTAGLLFVLNMKLKGKGNSIQEPTHVNYESWYPASTKFVNGMVRDLQMKFSLRNIGTRGLFAWRAASVRGCKIVGVAANQREECCSLAFDDSAKTCLGSCIPTGASSTMATACCSERAAGGVCI